ncbi:Ribonucleotide reductase class II vitamin B12-dependent domain protein, partial [mine drainage metagenome]
MAVSRKRTASPADPPASRPANRIGRDPIPVPRLVPRGKTAFDTVEWRTHDALIQNADGQTIFEQKGIRAPRAWSETSINIAASKYFRILDGRRENSVDGMIRRVCHWIAQSGLELGYLDTAEEATTLEESLAY